MSERRPGEWPREFEVACNAVRDAAMLARHLRPAAAVQSLTKSDRTPVTTADFAVQALIADRVTRAFHHDSLVAEEDATRLRASEGQPLLEAVVAALRPHWPVLSSEQVAGAIDRGRGAAAGRYWLLDPIDGTQGYLRGDQYAVVLALVNRGQVAFAVIACPELTLASSPSTRGVMAVAIRNGGAFQSPLEGGELVPLAVSSCRNSHLARLLRPFERSHIDLDRFNGIVQRLGVVGAPTPMDSQAKYVVLAAGHADALIRCPPVRNFRDKAWDVAAGSLLVEEAGGRTTDLSGLPFDFSTGRILRRNDGVVASNGNLQRAWSRQSEAGGVMDAPTFRHRRQAFTGEGSRSPPQVTRVVGISLAL